MIAEFESPVECVNAAIGFQKAINDRNNTLSEESQLDWRVGIHLDDVIIEGDNVYGNGVNIAADLRLPVRQDKFFSQQLCKIRLIKE